MRHFLTKVGPIDEDTYGNGVRTLRVLVECEKGSVHKYEFDDNLGTMVIVRDLDEKYPYPYNYGTVPQTLADDGDTLDAIVLSDEPIRSGTVVNCYPLCIVKMIDHGKQDDKLVCTTFYRKEGEVDLTPILKYLQEYKYPEPPGTTQLVGVLDVEEAYKAVAEAHKAYLAARGDR